jgi:GNAT superfamily N-acetyltransferase
MGPQERTQSVRCMGNRARDTPIAMEVEWRALGASDVPGACNLSRLAGWNQTESDWRGYLAFEPGGCLAALVDGLLVGTATCVRYGEAMGWIGMVLVHPDHRRLGLGRELLQRTIRYMKGKGTRSIRLDATAAGRKVYVPLGFRDDFEVTRFEGVGSGITARTAATSLDVQPLVPADVRLIAGLDARAFGVDRSFVLAALAARDPGLCFVAKASGVIAGFLIARQGREAIQLGPMVASTPPVAEGLFGAFYRAVRGSRLFMDLPMPNRAGAEILTRHGFTVQRSFTRMTLGEDGPAGNVDLVYGTSGAEKG